MYVCMYFYLKTELFGVFLLCLLFQARGNLKKERGAGEGGL